MPLLHRDPKLPKNEDGVYCNLRTEKDEANKNDRQNNMFKRKDEAN